MGCGGGRGGFVWEESSLHVCFEEGLGFDRQGDDLGLGVNEGRGNDGAL